MTYGNLGVVIGHEIVHGFDVNGIILSLVFFPSMIFIEQRNNMSAGRRYDRHGNMTHWWTDSLMREFSQRADCFVQQYSSFNIDHINKPVSGLGPGLVCQAHH